MQLIIVTGLSGSGKSVVLKALEDTGYYCVDNLPATLLPQIYENLKDTQPRIAISTDTRSAALEALPENIEKLKAQGIGVQVLFLESSTQALVKRFSETRRRHPLSSETMTLAESIECERQLLGPLAELGHHIDTSDLSANTLRGWVKDFVAQENKSITLLFTSFGFKRGIPLDADYVFDVRMLPNPHYESALRPMSGKDEPVQKFLQSYSEVNLMQSQIESFLDQWLPALEKDHRNYITVAIGCTGGQHRSVYLVEKLSQRFGAKWLTLKRHRELDSK